MSEGKANAELIRPPTSEGGVWGSFVEYLGDVELAEEAWRTAYRAESRISSDLRAQLEVAVAELDEAFALIHAYDESAARDSAELKRAKAERDEWRNQDQQVRDDFADALRDLSRAEVLIDQIESHLERVGGSDAIPKSMKYASALIGVSNLLAVYRNEVGK